MCHHFKFWVHKAGGSGVWRSFFYSLRQCIRGVIERYIIITLVFNLVNLYKKLLFTWVIVHSRCYNAMSVLKAHYSERGAKFNIGWYGLLTFICIIVINHHIISLSFVVIMMHGIIMMWGGGVAICTHFNF
jgi:hypothetical protein